MDPMGCHQLFTALFFTDKQLYAELYERIGIAVDTQNSGDGKLTAQTNGPRENLVATDVEQEEEGSFTVSFTPAEIGEYHTKVFWNDKQIQGSPFLVWVSIKKKELPPSSRKSLRIRNSYKHLRAIHL